MFEKQVITFPFIKGNVICKKDVLNLVHFVCVYILLWTVSKMLSPKQLVEPVEHSCPQLSSFPRSRPLRPTPRSHGGRRLPGESAWGNTPLHAAAYDGHVKAAEFLVSKGAAVDATRNDGPGPRRQEAGSEILSLQLGALQKVFRAWNSAMIVCVFSRCLGEVWLSASSKHARNLGVNHRNVTCQYVWIFRLRYLLDCFADGTQITRWSTFKNAAKHWWQVVLNVQFGKTDGPPSLEVVDVCVIKLLAMSGHVSLHDHSLKWPELLQSCNGENLHRMSITSPGPKVKRNGVSLHVCWVPVALLNVHTLQTNRTKIMWSCSCGPDKMKINSRFNVCQSKRVNISMM